MADNSKCIILMPVGGGIERATQDCLNGLRLKGYQIVTAWGSSNVELTRCQLASQFLDLGYEEIFWIDSDMVFTVEDFEKLRSYDLPLVCGIYPKKVPGSDLNIGLPKSIQKVTFGNGGGLVEVDWCGTGFFCTKKCVYDDIKNSLEVKFCRTSTNASFTPYFMSYIINNDEGLPSYLPDDRAFCAHAKRCGYKIYVDTSIRLKHIGKYEYSWEDFIGDRPRFETLTLDIDWVDE